MTKYYINKNKIKYHIKMMKFGNYLLRYSILSLLLVFPVNILGENISKDLKKEPGGKFGYNIQRKLENENYISLKFGKEINGYITKSFKSCLWRDYPQVYYKFIYDNTEYDDINFKIDANKIIKISFSETALSLNYFLANDIDNNLEYLTYADLSHFDSSKTTQINNLFCQCHSLKEVNFTNFKTPSLLMIHAMFYNCYNLVSVDLSYLNTSKITNMDNIFKNCSSLVSINLSNFETSQVIRMYELFEHCISLKYLDISNFNPSTNDLQMASNTFSDVKIYKYI